LGNQRMFRREVAHDSRFGVFLRAAHAEPAYREDQVEDAVSALERHCCPLIKKLSCLGSRRISYENGARSFL
jgi:hypothetical protein